MYDVCKKNSVQRDGLVVRFVRSSESQRVLPARQVFEAIAALYPKDVFDGVLKKWNSVIIQNDDFHLPDDAAAEPVEVQIAAAQECGRCKKLAALPLCQDHIGLRDRQRLYYIFGLRTDVQLVTAGN